jgi:glutathione S-transferase
LLTILASAAFWAGVDISDYPALKAWEERMNARPALKKGRDVPQPYTVKEKEKNQEAAWKSAEATRSWIQRGMAIDAKK